MPSPYCPPEMDERTYNERFARLSLRYPPVLAAVLAAETIAPELAPRDRQRRWPLRRIPFHDEMTPPPDVEPF